MSAIVLGSYCDRFQKTLEALKPKNSKEWAAIGLIGVSALVSSTALVAGGILYASYKWSAASSAQPLTQRASLPTALPMQFDYEQMVNENIFKINLDHLGYSSREIETIDLQTEFKKLVIDSIVERRSIDPKFLIRFYGFESEEAVSSFLKDPTTIQILKKRVNVFKDRMSESLFSELKSTYWRAREKQQPLENDILARINGTDNLLPLFDIFDFIRNRSDKEISVLEDYCGNGLENYLSGNSLKQFKYDLENMELDQFERKYEGCFAGMLGNVVKRAIDAEELFRALTF